MEPLQHPELTISRLLDRVMPAPVALGCVVAVVLSVHPAWTAVLSVLFVGLNLLLNVAVARSQAAAVKPWWSGWLGMARVGVTLGVVPLLVWSAGAAQGTWLVSIPALLALPLFVEGASLPMVPSVLLVGLIGLALGAAGQTPASALVACGVLLLLTLSAAPIMAALRGQILDLMRLGVSLERASQEAIAAHHHAEQARQTRERFLANMSHEIRTPISGILGMLELAATESAERDDYIRLARGAGQHLLGIINDILDLSKLESGKVTLAREPLDVVEAARSAAEVTRLGASAPIPILIDHEGLTHHVREGDVLRLRQILLNLLGNAQKFTHQGHICITLRDAPGDALLLEVSDTGIGMSPEQVARVLRPFEQADDSTSRRYGGTGLGLTITSRLVEAWAGALEITSTPGVGTRFSLILPLPPSTRAPPETDTGAPLDAVLGLHILVAEDSALNQIIIRSLLGELGCTTTLARNGIEAVEAIYSGAERFDAILMDVQMPIMDGLTATRHLRRTGCELPILALTANVMPEDQLACLVAGMDGFLTKPLERQRLHATLQRTQDRKLSRSNTI